MKSMYRWNISNKNLESEMWCAVIEKYISNFKDSMKLCKLSQQFYINYMLKSVG